MNIVKRWFQNAGKAYALQKKYYRLTTSVGLIALFFVSIPIFLFLVTGAAIYVGATDVPRSEFSNLLAILSIIPSGFIALVLGFLLTSGMFALVMWKLGYFTAQEAKAYVFYGEFPRHWFG